MSIEMHVFFRGKLPSKAALTRAMKGLGFPFTIKPATGPLDEQHGYMPMLLRRDETGVEFDVYNDPAALAEFADVGFDPSFDRMASFRWAGDPQEMVAGMCCAAALAKLVGGIVFDAEAGKLRALDEAIAFARSHLDRVAEPKGARVPGTLPADIKRYLKPLLKLRSDLVLVGRHLLIRPVRHLLRGALLDRTGDKYSFQIWYYDKPLYEPAGYVGSRSIHRARWKVYEPYFEALLLDSLKEDVFDEVGKLTSVPEVKVRDRFVALVLWGRLDEAAEMLNEAERRQPPDPHRISWIEEQRKLLASGIPALCEEYHAKERATAEAMKLGDAWEPSSFPVEVTGSQRTRIGSEPTFLTAPWVDRPASLYQELPQHAGETCFAKAWLYRNGEPKLITPLTSAEAQEERRSYEPYIHAARLEGGLLLCLRYDAGRNRRDPDQPKRVANQAPVAIHFQLWVFGPSGIIYADFSTSRCPRGIIKLSSLELCRTGSLVRDWIWSPNYEEDVTRIWDQGQTPTMRTLTDQIISLCVFPVPAFLEYEEFWRRARTLLELEGFGPFA